MGKNGRTLFDRPKPRVGCSANGRRRRRRRRRRILINLINDKRRGFPSTVHGPTKRLPFASHDYQYVEHP